MRQGIRRLPGRFGLILLLAVQLAGCAAQPPQEQRPAQAVRARGAADSALVARAPAFLLEGVEADYNRIGRVEAHSFHGRESIGINTAHPAVYMAEIPFATEKGRYLNLVYRIHFPGVPFPFHLGAGRNVGILVILTLDEHQRLVLVTTANSCGCYAVTIPTSLLPPSALPADWPEGQLAVFGEQLPARLDLGAGEKVVLVRIRAEVHRVMGISLAAADHPLLAAAAPAEPAGLEELKALPLGNGAQTSFYYQRWPLTGHVKGSVKPWETLLLSLASLDLFIGADKEYGGSGKSGNPFFTSLKPWNRHLSDMNDFAGYLRFNGWRL